MKLYTHIMPRNVCSKEVSFEIYNGRLHNIKFVGGCPGNLLAIGKLLEGKDAALTAVLKGNPCGNRGTSCTDQLAIAILDALNKKGN